MVVAHYDPIQGGYCFVIPAGTGAPILNEARAMGRGKLVEPNVDVGCTLFFREVYFEDQQHRHIEGHAYTLKRGTRVIRSGCQAEGGNSTFQGTCPYPLRWTQ